MELSDFSCMDCSVRACVAKDKKYPAFCPTVNKTDLREKSLEMLSDEEEKRFMIAAAETETEGYMKLTRLEEIILFAKKMNYKKLGIASCMGLKNESALFTKILKNRGFEVVGAICKVGATPKHEVGIPVECEVIGEVMCNPVLQAEILNEAGTELNIIMGLCVGHDSLFMMHSKAPCTCFIVKDRVLAHNPAAALYLSDSFYSRVKNPE